MNKIHDAMDIIVLGIGKTNMGFVEAGMQEYQNRLRRYVPFRCEWLKDVKGAGRISEDRQKALEEEAFLAYLTPNDHVVLLDEKGKEFTSREFALWIEKRMAAGRKRIIFIIGGPYGFGDRIYKRADEMVSLSRMTFNHEMIRLFFTEQIYRAMTILRNEPYHHD